MKRCFFYTLFSALQRIKNNAFYRNAPEKKINYGGEIRMEWLKAILEKAKKKVRKERLKIE